MENLARIKQRLINKLLLGAYNLGLPEAHIRLKKEEVEMLYELLPGAEVEFVMSREFCDEMLTKLGVDERLC